MLPLARVKNVNAYAKDLETKHNIEMAMAKRYELISYIMSSLIKISLEGGSFINPLFINFKSKEYVEIVMKSMTQFMLGSKILVAPVIEKTNQIFVFFPKDVFYDYETGKIMNPNGEINKQVIVSINQMPMYVREGSVFSIQKFNNVKSIMDMRKQPLQLIIGFDSNYRANGSIFIDDGICKQY